jgi:metallo-beta-lactamase class B
MSASIAALAAAPCDILITAHPDIAGLWSVVDEHGKGDRAQLVDSSACQRFATAAKAKFAKRLEGE